MGFNFLKLPLHLELQTVTICYTLQTKLLLKSNHRKQKSTIKNGGKSSNIKNSKFKS